MADNSKPFFPFPPDPAETLNPAPFYLAEIRTAIEDEDDNDSLFSNKYAEIDQNGMNVKKNCKGARKKLQYQATMQTNIICLNFT